jgi:hypothetical protein
MNYKICLRHSGPNDNTFLFWGPNNSGYTRSIEDAGLYEDSDVVYETQIKRGDFLVPYYFVQAHKEKIQLPKYSEYQELYSGRNIFNVLPNTGDIRKLLGINTLNFQLDGNRNSFNAYFKSTIKEVLKTKFSKNTYHIQGKEKYFNEWYYVECTIEAENRNKAIEKARHELYLDEYSYIEFKKMVSCKKLKETYFHKWEKIKD